MIAQRILVLSRTVALAREVQSAAGSGCVIIHHDRVTDLEDVLVAEDPFDLIVAGPVVDSRAGLARLASLRQEHPHLAVLLALTTPPKSSLSDIVRAGAVDLVQLPAEPRVLRAAIQRALTIEPPVVVVEDQVAAAPQRPLAEVITIASPSGGCGKTFYSTNLAYFLQRASNQRVCLIDLDLQFGEVTAALRLKPRYTMTDAVTREDFDEIDLANEIEEYLVSHPAGFWVLPAPRNPAEADQISPPDVTKVVSALRRHFDYIVLDTSAQLSEIVLAAMDQSTRLICMATLDLPSIRNMRVFIETLTKLKVPTDAVSVIMNKVEPDMGIKVEEANEALHNKIVSVLPYAREVTRSINEGAPVLACSPKADISNQLVNGMRRQLAHILPAVPANPAAFAPQASTKRWGRKGKGPGAPTPPSGDVAMPMPAPMPVPAAAAAYAPAPPGAPGAPGVAAMAAVPVVARERGRRRLLAFRSRSVEGQAS